MTLSHLDDQGQAQMVDVSDKADTARVAVAKGEVAMQPQTLALIRAGALQKGDVLAVARVAGIMAAKKTSELIPLCHPLALTHVSVEFDLSAQDSAPGQRCAIEITGTVKTTDKTGVEMEALMAVTIAALTIFDMAKAVDRGMRVQNVRLVRKSGGKSGDIVLE